MSKIDVARSDITQEIADWQHVVDLMRDTNRDFKRADTLALPPDVQPAGQAFVQAWTLYARESQTDAGDVVSALEETLRDFDATDGNNAEAFTGFIIGCGPEPVFTPAIGCFGGEEAVAGPALPDSPTGDAAMSSFTSRLGDLP